MRWLLLSTVLLTACDTEKIAQLEKQNKKLATQLETVSKKTTLALQEKCAKQERAEYKARGFEKDELADFTSHYNAKLDKCFMEIRTSTYYRTDRLITHSRTVLGAFETKIYAEYYSADNTDKKASEIPRSTCTVVSLTGEEQSCNSVDAFDELIKQYMSQ